jgi:hypothetical protein
MELINDSPAHFENIIDKHQNSDNSNNFLSVYICQNNRNLHSFYKTTKISRHFSRNLII